ncbi:MAG: hypothetical protein ISS81_03195 [Candidatus Marinimicrobia bacterium]|nr:hypothetical protein [Candidatus Neomarinimicrobiota bacterium]
MVLILSPFHLAIPIWPPKEKFGEMAIPDQKVGNPISVDNPLVEAIEKNLQPIRTIGSSVKDSNGRGVSCSTTIIETIGFKVERTEEGSVSEISNPLEKLYENCVSISKTINDDVLFLKDKAMNCVVILFRVLDRISWSFVLFIFLLLMQMQV